MSKRDARLLLQDMLQSMERIRRYIVDLDLAAFLNDEKTSDAVVRNVEIIGEATRQLPETFKHAHAEIPWHQMAGMRNRIVHDYVGVDLELVWAVVTESLPSLTEHLCELKSKLE